MIVIVYGQDGRLQKFTDVKVITTDDNYIYITRPGDSAIQLSRSWIIKLEVL